MDESCDLCGADALDCVYRPHSQRGLSVHLCASCGHVQSLPRIDRAERRGPSVSGGADWGNVRYGKGFRTAAAMAVLGGLDWPGDARVLDVGTNRGAFLKAWRAAHADHRVTALEPDARLVGDWCTVPGIEAIVARLEDTHLPDQAFDLVHSCHTLEHLASARWALGHHARVLKPGGLLWLDLPDLAFIGRADVVEEFFIDKHLHHFSAAALAHALAQAGFEALSGPHSDGENLTVLARRADRAAPPVPQPATVAEARRLIAAYEATRSANRAALAQLARRIAAPGAGRVVIWGAGRLFDGLVREGGFDPKRLAGLIDTGLCAHMAERHGVALSAPDALPALAPDLIVVMSRAFAAEITAEARARAPRAAILTFAALMDETRSAA